MASYDLKAILGEKLKRLTDKTLKALVDCMCTVGASLCSLDKRVSALESVELPEGGYKPMQEPVASPSASGTDIQFIESVSQDATGRMTATKKTVQDGTTSQKGAVQLEDSYSSTSTTKAATPNSVKSAYDLANTANTGLANKLDKTGDGKDVTASFTDASSRVNIGTGEKLSVMFGKIKKWFTDLKALAFKDTVSDSDISGTISENHIASASTWNGKADKASSGNGMLAVIDSNGNYGSSGITAYNQSQINGVFSGKVIPSLQKRSQIDEQIYEFICNGSTVGKAVKFTDEYAGENRLTFGLEFASDGTVLQFYLPINNFEENEWIWEGQTPGGSPVGVVELYAGCIKNTNGTIVSFSGHSEHAIDAYNGSAVISVKHFGGINVGSTTRANDSYSKVNIVMKITNTITGKYVVITFDLGVTSFANGSANQAYAIGVARCNSYGFNS